MSRNKRSDLTKSSYRLVVLFILISININILSAQIVGVVKKGGAPKEKGTPIGTTITTTHSIGESYGGGIVFFVYDNGQHGLIAAKTDQSTGIEWGSNSYKYTRAMADGVGAGLKNTAIIIATQVALDRNKNLDPKIYAASICNEYSVRVDGVTYGDWYLPSKHELNLMYANIGQGALSPNTNIGGFGNHDYWSSTEANAFQNEVAKSEGYYLFAWMQRFHNGTQDYQVKNVNLYVRAIRAF